MPHLTLYDQLGDMPILGAMPIVGRGLEPLGRRGPESSPKVSFMTRGHLIWRFGSHRTMKLRLGLVLITMRDNILHCVDVIYDNVIIHAKVSPDWMFACSQ